MAIFLSFLLSLTLPFAATAKSIYTTKDLHDCDPLPAHVAAPDVAYKPNVTADGWALESVDASPNPFGEGAFESFQIGLDIPVNPFVPDLEGGGPADPRRDFSESEVGLGVLEVNKSGSLRFNGKEISTHQGTLPDGCE